ncbi:type IV secretion system DNA-binding domain-containing protein [Candidatus Parcubacteria bacterium]|nr:type IV secretion system DNA-binding domain-containing protein [Candidatus Parcubacteria bacterium]
MEGTRTLEQKLRTPEEEFEHLRRETAAGSPENSPEERAAAALETYKQVPHGEALAPEYRMPEGEREGIVLNLKPETHDAKMEELLTLLLEKGVKNAMAVAADLYDPHVDDDFHRFLVQYLLSTGRVDGLDEKQPLFRGINMKLYRIAVPRQSASEEKLSEFVSRMEQFYAGMLSIGDGMGTEPGKNYFTLELALPENESALALYAAVPRDKTALFEKQFVTFYPGASLAEVTDDYNVFVQGGASLGAVGQSMVHEALSLKTYDKFDHDPFDVLLTAFSKIRKDGEGAAVQLLVSPAGDFFIKRFGKVLDDVSKGISFKAALPTKGFLDAFARAGNDLFFAAKKDTTPEEREGTKLHLKEKIGSTIASTNLRIVVSARTSVRAKELLGELTAAFSQLRAPEGNGISFSWKEGRAALRLFHEFSYRLFSEASAVPLNLKELATIFHVPKPSGNIQIVEAKAKSAPAPLTLPEEGAVLGVNKYQGEEREVRMASEDRMRHLYLIGQTGTGKTTLMKRMVIEDIKRGAGVCVIDPHGSDLETILKNIPDNRVEDVIYFDPGHTARPIGLNMLEYDPRFPEQKTFVVNELLAIFNKLFDMKVAGGPAFEQYFRNAAFLVMEDPASGNTLLEIARVMSDKAFRKLKLSKCKNPIVLQFWQNAERTTGDQGLANFVPYITSKFDVFLSNDIMRPIVAQERSSFNFRDVMDQKKILLVNLSKGRLGDINSALLGLIIVGKLLMAALSRTDAIAAGTAPPDFFFYIDEFQNVTTDSIATIFSEARKYRLSLTVAHQYIAQLDERTKNAVFGNVGSLVSFRVGQEDAEVLEKQFAPVFTASDFTSLENRNAYVKLLMGGVPQKPFSIETLPAPEGSAARAIEVKARSAGVYGEEKEVVDEMIRRKYAPPETEPSVATATGTL